MNYDNNLENLTGKRVYHLHGDFSTLAESENPEYVSGFIRNNNNSRVLIKGMEHCFCNALLNYSGHEKLKVAIKNHKLLEESQNFKFKYDNDEKFRQYVLNLKESRLEEYEILITKINHQNLKIAQEYYFHKLSDIKDELHIIGISPNNDGHIFDYINSNKNLNKVYFYYNSDRSKEIIDEKFSKDLYIAKDVNELWEKLNCEKKSYNVKYEFTNAQYKIIEACNYLSDDIVHIDKILHEISKIPKFRAIELCKLAKEELEKNESKNKSFSLEEHKKEISAISHIALSEGILPSVLYLLYIIHSSKV